LDPSPLWVWLFQVLRVLCCGSAYGVRLAAW